MTKHGKEGLGLGAPKRGEHDLALPLVHVTYSIFSI